MWSFIDPVWETVFKWATIAALLFGGVGVAAAFVSAWVGYKITDATQKDANVRIVESQTRSNEAKAEAERAKAEVARADEAIAKATERTAELEKNAAEARAEQEHLKAQLAWRTLSPNVLDRLVAALVDGSGSVAIGYTQNDPEAIFLAVQISLMHLNALIMEILMGLGNSRLTLDCTATEYFSEYLSQIRKLMLLN